MGKSRPVFLVSDNNELYNKLNKENKDNKNLYFIKNQNFEINSIQSHKFYDGVFKLIDKNIEFKSNNFWYKRQSYFPDHKSEYKRYVASPFYVLESKTELNDDKFNIYLFSKIISLIVLVFGAWYYRKLFTFSRD
jgi:hypothetical protein